ncbi:MAG TPA: chitobiase/beta-hexosaminidase C-terminal domain-containing protein, partial [Candidatus Dormibacteraeota bacterium]|nr:chitobiase/beta-hexosaminidase C-terminal domain-containing protein [Candidatus Dormibacteraeota bacterium]
MQIESEPKMQRWRRIAVFSLAVSFVLLLVGGQSGIRAMAASPTVVSLTFDDGRATQYVARSILASYGMRGTFYINSPRLGTSSFYLTWQQVQDLASDGNEIGGHDAYHSDLTQIDPTEAQREICNDRVNLLNHGLQPTDFAYPYGAYTPAIESMVQACGYNSARTTDVLGTAFAEGIPPQNAYAIRQGSGSNSLSTMENVVTAAEQNGGGWLPMVFHDICAGCSSVSINQADFSSFLSWLQGQTGNGVVVQTVQQVIGGSVHSAVPGPAAPPAPFGSNPLRNPSLDQNTIVGTAPDCFQFDQSGSNNFAWTRTTAAHTGTYAEQVNVTNYTDGDNKLLVQEDMGHCTPSVTPGHQYRLTTWYQSNATPLFIAFSRDTTGTFAFWTSSPNFAASSSWVQATWITPPIPNGISGLSFGLGLTSNGQLTVDDIGIDDAAASPIADTTPPTVSVTAPTGGATVSSMVTISANAADNVMVDHVDFLVDGVVVGTILPPESGPSSFSWNSHAVSNGNHTITVRAVDSSGNATTSSSVKVFVSNQTTNVLQNASLEQAGANNVPTCWLLGGYGTNTYSWTRTTDAHTGTYAENLSISSYSSGDRKLVNTQDSGTCAPAGIPGHSYTISAWYKSAAQPAFFTYYLTSSGWVFWAASPKFSSASSWTQASWSTPVLPSGATNLSVGMGLFMVGAVTIDDFSLVDNAPPPDATPPTTTIACNNAGAEGSCASGFYNGPVQIVLTAVDNVGGSGVASIRYTTNGTDPSLTNGTVYGGPFDVATSGTTVKYRAYDNAGNAEAVHSQLIQIDTIPPTSSISCNGAACSSTAYGGSVSVGLSATDAGGSGVRTIIYTTNGTDPSTANGTPYLGTFSIASTATVKFRAYDNAGNAEAVNSQLIQVDTTAPTSTISCNGSSCATTFYNASVTVSLSATDAESGIASIVYTTDGSDPSKSNGTVYVSTFVVGSTTTVKYRAYDNAGNAEPVNSQLIQIDTIPPASTISCNGIACASGFYNATVSISLAATDSGGSGVASIRYTTDGTDPSLTNGNVYGGAFSLPGSTTVKYRAYDNAGNVEPVNSQLIQIDTTAPTVSITSPANGAIVSGTINLEASASDNVAVDHVDFLVDGQRIGTDSALPYSLAWNSASVPDGSHTIQVVAFDSAANQTTAAVTVTVENSTTDTIPPVSTIACNGAACSGGYYNAAVSITLSATDNPGGTGVASIRYTTDGSDPSLTNGNTYGGAFSLASTTTVKYRAYDNAGNAEAVNVQVIQIDTVAPSSTISCNGTTCASTYYNAAVSMALSATDNAGGSGVASIRYTTDGSDPSLTNGSIYAAAFSLSGTTTVKYRAYDNAGNAEPINQALIRIDTVPPSTAISCNGAACGNGYYQPGVSVAISATDADSGVASIRYTTDGTDPSLTNGSVYTAPFALSATTTVKYVAYDNVGNVATIKSQLVQVDAIAPTVSLTSPSSGAFLSGTVSLSANASDNIAVARVDFLVDSQTVGSAAAAPYAFGWNSKGVADGAHSIAARAVDSAGNTTTTSSALVTVTNNNLLQNASLENAGSNNVPTCWLLGGYGTNTYTWTHTTDAHSGSFAENVNITSYTSGDRKLVNVQDTGTCA